MIGWLRRRMGWLTGRNEKQESTVTPMDLDRALQEKEEAQQRLDAVQDRWGAVRDVADELRRQRRRNDFAERIYKAWGR